VYVQWWLQRGCGNRWPWTAAPLCNLGRILSDQVNPTALTTSGLDCVDLAWAAGSIILRIGIWWISAFPNSDYVSYCFESPDVLPLSNILVVMYISSIVMNHVRLEEMLSLNQRHLEIFPFLMCFSCITEQNARSNVWKAKLCLYDHYCYLILLPMGKHTKYWFQ